MKNLKILLFSAFIIMAMFYKFPETIEDKKKEAHKIVDICFPSICIRAEVAETDDQRHKGLMFRERLPENEGMIFVFDDEAYHSFWMKNTLISLDMIWADKNLNIVHIAQAVPCKTEDCPRYTPEEKGNYVIEVNAGFTQQHGIKVGDKVNFDL